MDATTSPSPDARIARFSRAERWVHRSITVLMIVLIATAAALYFPDISVLVGNRPIVSNIHVIAGFVLPIPLILALASRAFRQDAELLNRFTAQDWRWLRSRDRRLGRIPVGKFNAGQKLNAAFSVGSIIIMLATGSIMFFNEAHLKKFIHISAQDLASKVSLNGQADMGQGYHDAVLGFGDRVVQTLPNLLESFLRTGS